MIGDDRIMVSHLQFVDDTIIFLKANRDNISNMELCLKKFELISGLKVNMIKSCMVGIHIEDGVLKNLVEVIGCKVRPLKYLGMPPGRNSKAVSFWDPMVKKIAKK